MKLRNLFIAVILATLATLTTAKSNPEQNQSRQAETLQQKQWFR